MIGHIGFLLLVYTFVRAQGARRKIGSLMCQAIYVWKFSCARTTPNDPKLSDCGARRAGCGRKAATGRMGEGGGMAGSSQRDARSSPLQRMVRRHGFSDWRNSVMRLDVLVESSLKIF
jgi:hypothetical protein